MCACAPLRRDGVVASKVTKSRKGSKLPILMLHCSCRYHVSETHLLPMPDVGTDLLLEHPANEAYDQVVYLLTVNRVDGGNQTCGSAGLQDVNSTRSISALTDVATGEGAINIKCEGNYTAALVVRDGAGFEVPIREWGFQVLRKDTAVPEYGPDGSGCANGNAVDGEPMDRHFTCNCAGTGHPLRRFDV